MFVNMEKAYKKFGKRAEEKTDKAVFTCIADHTNPEGKAFVPQNTIADETGYTRRTVSNSIHRLAEKGLLTVEKSLTDNTGTVRGIASNIYRINPKYLMKTEDAKPANASTPYCSATNDVRRLHHDMTRLHDVLVDVVTDILLAAERNNK